LLGRKINNTSVEVPMGTTLREIIYEIGEEFRITKIQAAQTGGPSGDVSRRRIGHCD
jgi:NADH:ubiquinone oxidoreductase subunit F (NADH-binding)